MYNAKFHVKNVKFGVFDKNQYYFNVSPTSTTITFPTQTSPFSQDFCITANGNHPDLEVQMFPLSAARPGFDMYYKIICKNVGNISENASLDLSFNNDVMAFLTTSTLPFSQSYGHLNWHLGNIDPFSSNTVIISFRLNSPTDSPSLNAGNVLTFTSTLSGSLTDETATNNLFFLYNTLVNSLDPNDKICLEGDKIVPSSVGDYVHYQIRFQNTGTFPAQNIVVKDNIDVTKFDVSTLQLVDSSHDCETRLTGNKVEFIFKNINLPFNNGINDGYLVFKIKTLPTLSLGDTFRNTANIYFDYNAPIVTNTATTIIAALANPEFVFTDYFTLSPIPTKGVLNINTKQDITISSISIYNTLGQVVLVTSNPSNTIDVSNLTTGSYFVKVITDKGTSSGKFIKE